MIVFKISENFNEVLVYEIQNQNSLHILINRCHTIFTSNCTQSHAW